MNFIERIFGFSPDGGSATFEVLVFAIPIVGLYLLYKWRSCRLAESNGNSVLSQRGCFGFSPACQSSESRREIPSMGGITGGDAMMSSEDHPDDRTRPVDGFLKFFKVFILRR